jgi:hypothetical protein
VRHLFSASIRLAADVVTFSGTSHVRRTQQPRKLWGAFELFAACYDLSGYQELVIMTGSDGVGTKLELLLDLSLDPAACSKRTEVPVTGDPFCHLA